MARSRASQLCRTKLKVSTSSMICSRVQSHLGAICVSSLALVSRWSLGLRLAGEASSSAQQQHSDICIAACWQRCARESGMLGLMTPRLRSFCGCMAA